MIADKGPKPRRMFEPRSRFDRLVYVLLALTGPQTAAVCLNIPDREFLAFIVAGWSLVATFYTIEWALLSYRAWRLRSKV